MSNADNNFIHQGNPLRSIRIAFFGIGCVGGYAAEVLARSGIGSMMLIDSYKVGLVPVNCRRSLGSNPHIAGNEHYRTDIEKERI